MPKKRTIEYKDRKNIFKKEDGFRIRKIDIDLQKEKNAVKVEPTDGDNRRYIIRLIVNNIRSGKTEEEALDIALNDKVSKSFSYLEKNGLDKRECFRNWFTSYLKLQEKQQKVFKER